MPRRTPALAVLAALAALGWWLWPAADPAPTAPAATGARTADPGLGRALAASRAALAGEPGRADDPADDPGDPGSHGQVTISGTIIDVVDHQGIGPVEVVFSSPLGEITATSAVDGTYQIRLAPGLYHAFVRDDAVLSVGFGDRVRLPGPPSADAAGSPDDTLMPLVIARADTAGLDLGVLRGGLVEGRVVDGSGRPVAGVVLRATGDQWRPALGTDVTETDASGRYQLHLPEGVYHLDAAHDRYAGLRETDEPSVVVEARGRLTRDLTLDEGCVITGRVVGADGRPASDGAIERKYGETDHEFAPAGQIDPDGRFRWATTEEGSVTIRAWPWKSPPSAAQQFACRPGVRHRDVVFTLPASAPSMEGVLVDRTGAAVPFAYVDVHPLDAGYGQQERTDAAGKWQVYDMPAGRYAVTASATGRGVVMTTVTSPATNLRLTLGGTGRIDGTATVAEGSFELVLDSCGGPDGAAVGLPHEPRLVTIHGGRFSVAELPACDLGFLATSHGRKQAMSVTVPAGGVATAEIDLAAPRAKVVHGVVHDAQGHPVAGAEVLAYADGEGPTTVARTDEHGQYRLSTVSGAEVHVTAGMGGADATVGRANVAEEELDLTLVAPDIMVE
jgi:protocatechuate 3,4-dioxygenase beta subunit